MSDTPELDLCIDMAGTLCDSPRARNELAALRETADRRLRLLRKLVENDFQNEWCPFCTNHRGHAPDCELEKELA